MPSPHMQKNSDKLAVTLESDGYCIVPAVVHNELLERMHLEVTRTYSAGETESEQNEVIYGTACPSMVSEAHQQWMSGNRNHLPLNRLVSQMFEIASDLLESRDELGCGPAQIAVREPGVPSPTPHIDGYSKNEPEPNTPRAIVGVYLTDVLDKGDGALMVWPGERAAIANLRDARRFDEAEKIAKACGEGNAGCRPLLGPAGTIFIVDGNVPHANAARAIHGKRIAVYLRVY
ncbi:phytanoyl-CoA dioxygenase family protein [Paraburkholderia sp. RL17-347-BIC-D]|uniref:phytanoyl-CoA dioxygenase family protein n=1 Tax=Paraburkholderia sp. RL17-347-BIC-D TaxID=3031632 RepID=UPI0038B81AE1